MSALPNPLVLLHLSDIHFSKSLFSAPFDLDANLRNELELDIGRTIDDVGAPAGILVAGDIAFSGQRDEYDRAGAWLGVLANLVRCPQENVWCVPGNHDVDRQVITGRRTVRDLHSRLRTDALSTIDKS